MNNKLLSFLMICAFSSVVASEPEQNIIAQVRRNNADVSDYRISKIVPRLSAMPVSELDDFIKTDEISELQLIVNPDNITIHGNSKEYQHQSNGLHSKNEYKIDLADESLVELKNQLRKELSTKVAHAGLVHRMIDNSKMLTPKCMIRFVSNVDIADTNEVVQSVMKKDPINFVEVVLTKEQMQQITGEKSYMPYTETIIVCSAGLIAFLMYYFNR